MEEQSSSLAARCSTPMVPEQKGFLATAFGHFASKDFWLGLFAMIVRETTYAFITHVGSSLIHYAQSKASPDTDAVRRIATGGMSGGQPGKGPTNAFSRPGNPPVPEYSPSYPPVPINTPVGQPGHLFGQ